MAYDFDAIVNRRGTGSAKWDSMEQRHGEKNLLPFWVADMDFEVALPIQRAMAERLRHPVYGYTQVEPSVYDAITDWLERRHGWCVDSEWISFTTGVVNALNLIIQTFTLPGDKIVVQPPVYAPFFKSVLNNGRQVVYNSLICANDCFIMDLDHLEAHIDSRTRLLILCSPHNPVGRVWKRRELEQLAEICLRHNILMISDEIHSDFVYPDHRHIPLASLSPEVAQNTITCMAPSKTFNLAGLATSFVVIPNRRFREVFGNTLENVGVSNAFLGITALEAAYRFGEEWLDELLTYLKGNLDYMQDFLRERALGIEMKEPEGTFLTWLDCRELVTGNLGLHDFFVYKAKIMVNDGQWFGPNGSGFVRFNIGCPRALLRAGLSRIEAAVKDGSGVFAD